MSDHKIPRFVLDESCFSAPGGAVHTLVEALEDLAERIHECLQNQLSVAFWSKLWERQIFPNISLLEVLYDSDKRARFPSIDSSVFELLGRVLDRCSEWDDLAKEVPVPDEITIDGHTTILPSVAFAAVQATHSRAIGCITSEVLSGRKGPKEVVVNQQRVTVHFIVDRPTRTAFFRDLPEIENLDEEAYCTNAAMAFPSLCFHPTRTRFQAFDESYREIRAKVTHHLSVLNDHAQQLFRECKGDHNKIMAAFRARGVEASPENANTKKNAAAWEERKVEISDAVGTQTFYCEWHTKIRPNLDRIHFHPNTSGAHDERNVIIGIFTKHLS